MISNTSRRYTTLFYVRSDIPDLLLHYFRSVEDQQNLSASRHVSSQSTSVLHAPFDSTPCIRCTRLRLQLHGAHAPVCMGVARTWDSTRATYRSPAIFSARSLSSTGTRVSPTERLVRSLCASLAGTQARRIFTFDLRGEVLLFSFLSRGNRTKACNSKEFDGDRRNSLASSLIPEKFCTFSVSAILLVANSESACTLRVRRFRCHRSTADNQQNGGG